MVNIIFDTFNNIENFAPNMIPDINSNGVICGLKYEPLRLEVNYQEKLVKADSARFITLCANTINLLKERLKFKKDGVIVLMHNKDEDISLLKEYLIENKIIES